MDRQILAEGILAKLFDDLVVIDLEGNLRFSLEQTVNRVHSLGGNTRVRKIQEVLTPESGREVLNAVQTVHRTGGTVNMQLAIASEVEAAAGQTYPVVLVRLDYDRQEVLILGANRLAHLLTAEDQRREREKELACLFKVGQMLEEADTPEQFFRTIPPIIEAGFLIPEATRVSVSFGSEQAGRTLEQPTDTYRCMLNAGGDGAIVVATADDVTIIPEERRMMDEIARMTNKALEKYEQELELEQTLRRLSSIMDAIPDRIVLLDPQFNVLVSNLPLESDSDPVGQVCHHHYYDRATPCEDCPVVETLRTKLPTTRKRRTQRRSLVLQAFPVLTRTGELEAIVELVKDVTIEEQHQERWVHADKMSSLGQLTAGVAHEINNPVQFIRENLRIVREMLADVLPLLQREHAVQPDLRIARLPFPFFKEQIPVLVKDVEEGAGRIAEIVASLKQFARNDDGMLDEEVDIIKAVETSLRLTHNQTKNVAHLDRVLHGPIPRVMGNTQQIEQVLVNIIINACQAIRSQQKQPDWPGGKGRIGAGVGYDEQSEIVTIIISDTGPGMSHTVLRRVFEPFYTTKKDSGGTGLGLSIAYGIIQDHKGTVHIDSSPGAGTEFRICLPALAEEHYGESHTDH